MAVLERRVQRKVRDESAYRDWEQVWETLEQRLGGFPPKRHYYLLAGADDLGTMVWDREWPSFAAMEAAYDRMFTDGEAEQLGARASEIYEGERIEYYMIQ